MLKGPTDDFDKSPRGIMIMVEDPKFWELANESFISIPAGELGKREQWFSENHDHDTGAVAREFYYILPIPQPDGTHNTLVPVTKPYNNTNVADERGIKWIEIDATKYKGTQTMVLRML